jgi:APA family basic amino acid/polyamine antiporter
VKKLAPDTSAAGLSGGVEATTSEEGLVRGIRRWDLVALVLNAIIGSGIFGLPGRVFKVAGSWSLLAYLVCAVAVVLMILCFAEVSSRFRTTGGPYLYAREAFGPALGFQMGWLLWLARFTAFSALCNAWLDYLAFFWKDANVGTTRTIMICIIVVIFTAINIRGVRNSTLFNDVFTIGKLLALLLFVGVGLFFINPQNFSFADAPQFSSFSTAVLMLVFAFSGFEMSVIPAGEASDPRRNAPFALLTGMAIVVVLYILIQIVSIGTFPGLADSARPLADAAVGFMGPVGGAVIAAGALVSVTGTLNTIVLVGPRLLFAMAEQKQLPSVFAATHPRYKTPYVAILVSSVVMLVLTLQGSFVTSLTISTVIRLITYAATCVALPVLRNKTDAPPAAFRAPAGIAAAIGAVLLCGWLVTSSTQRDQLLTLYAVGGGVVLYLLFNTGRKSRTPG